MKLGTVKNYPRRKVWVVLARNKETGELASLGYSGRYTLVKQGRRTTTKAFYMTDSLLRHTMLLKFSHSSYRLEEANTLKQVIKAAENSKLKETWEIFVSRIGSAKCPVTTYYDFDFTVKRNVPIQLTLKENQ